MSFLAYPDVMQAASLLRHIAPMQFAVGSHNSFANSNERG